MDLDSRYIFHLTLHGACSCGSVSKKACSAQYLHCRLASLYVRGQCLPIPYRSQVPNRIWIQRCPFHLFHVASLTHGVKLVKEFESSHYTSYSIRSFSMLNILSGNDSIHPLQRTKVQILTGLNMSYLKIIHLLSIPDGPWGSLWNLGLYWVENSL